VDEVPPLRAVLVDDRRPLVQQARGEDRERAQPGTGTAQLAGATAGANGATGGLLDNEQVQRFAGPAADAMERTADFLFLRYIGHPIMEQNRELLHEWADYVASEIKQGADAFVFCHSPENLTAPHIAREFHHLVAEKTGFPPLPWETLKPGTPEQATLF
jgi:uncharacterized protein YecE (DUF72 family)